MKTILVILFFSLSLSAQNSDQEKKPDQQAQGHQQHSDLTKRDAKILCKQEGKKGQELKDCMREKTK